MLDRHRRPVELDGHACNRHQRRWTAIRDATISLVSRDGRRLYALQWYWVDGVVTPSDARAKAEVSWSRLTGRGDDAAAIVVYSRAATVKDAQAELQRFVDDAWPPVATALAQARELR